MDFKLIGCILLIVGTSIGAGMLGLPIASAQLGFTASLVLLLVCWFVMTAGALLILEVNLWLPQNSNLISMAKVTIGPIGQILAWIAYLLLLYTLLCAYIAGGSDLLKTLLKEINVQLPHWLCAILFTLIFSYIVYLGIRAVDYVNRGLMSIKLFAYLLLVILLIPFISLQNLSNTQWHYFTSATAITVTIASFGYATIVPSLRIYFCGNTHKLKYAIIIGSLIPLICYILWDMVIMGVIPLYGDNGLASILNSSNTTSDLVKTLSANSPNENAVDVFIRIFTSICVLTSFLGVSISLTDFFADGLQVEKKGKDHLIVHAITFLPPLLVVLFFPSFFIKGLEYAGICSMVLLILLPAWMAWRGRYHKKMATGFSVAGGKPLLVCLILFALFAIIRAFIGT